MTLHFRAVNTLILTVTNTGNAASENMHPAFNIRYDLLSTVFIFYFRLFLYMNYTQVGTCKMGPGTDKDAVVNPQLQVHGITNLRVVDASVMPTIPAAHTNAATFMIGEKAADMVKEFWRKGVF